MKKMLMSLASYDERGRTGIVQGSVKPLVLNRRQLVFIYGGASRLVARLLHASRHNPDNGWLRIVRPGAPGVEVLVDRASAEAAYQRILQGQFPPLLPSEIKAKAGKDKN